MLGMKIGIFPLDPGVRDSTTSSARQGIIPPLQEEIAWRSVALDELRAMRSRSRDVGALSG
jgi:hypothetical protein